MTTREHPEGGRASGCLVVLIVAAGVVLGGLALLSAYGLEWTSFPAGVWRDHPFDYGNIEFSMRSLSLRARLWGYDPMHLFGWTPNAFYNPLATLAASLFTGTGGGGEGAYRVWLLAMLLATSLCFLPLLPRAGRIGWVSGGLVAAWSSLLVYPMDVGLLDANPVQVLYTGQWAQRIGLALGLLSVERLWRALELLEHDRRQAAKRALAAGALWGACLFSHYMSGFAAAAAMAVLSLHHLAAGRLTGAGFRLRSLLVLPAALLVAGLLYADFFWIFLSVDSSHHHLPLLSWQIPAGALATVGEVVLPALPILLIPLARLLTDKERTRAGLSRALFPLLVTASVFLASPGSLLALFALVLSASLAASWVEREFRPRHWLPPTAFFLLVLACGPDSLQPFGLDLSALVPFHSAMGWAKLAGFSRFLLLAWLGVLVAEGLARDGRPLGQAIAGVLATIGLLVPFCLSLDSTERTGAQTFFGWMNRTDRDATRALVDRMRSQAEQTPADGYLLVEDGLHHPEGSGLAGRNLPHGHLPYLVGPLAGRPVLGGAVTTRLITHPLAHTGRGQLLCVDFEDLARDPYRVLDRLRWLGVSDVLAHSPDLITALEKYPAARQGESQCGLTHFFLEHHRPLLTDAEGSYLAGGRLEWEPDGVRVRLPTGARRARLRQVWYPFLGCTAEGPSGPRACTITAWRDEKLVLSGCLHDDPRPLEVDVPWIEISSEPDPAGPVWVSISSRPHLAPFVLMLLAWIAAAAIRFGLLRPSARGARK